MSDELITTNSQLPSHLVQYAGQKGQTGLEEMRDLLTPPRLKVLQATKGSDYDAFPVGMAIVTPSNTVVCDFNGHFAATILYTFQQYCVHNPYKRPEGMPVIRESTFDFNSEIAAKCRNFISEPFPEDPSEVIKYATHINSLIIVQGIPELANTPVMLSQYLGEWKAGRRMLDLLNARTSDGTPIYVHNLMAKTSVRTKDRNKWYGLDWANPTADVDCGRYVPTAELVEKYRDLHEQCKADKERFNIKYEDEVEAVETVESDTL